MVLAPLADWIEHGRCAAGVPDRARDGRDATCRREEVTSDSDRGSSRGGASAPSRAGETGGLLSCVLVFARHARDLADFRIGAHEANRAVCAAPEP